MFYSYPHKYPLKQNRLPIVVCVQVAFWLLVLGNFETLGSKFSHETVGLLASYTTIQGSQIRTHYRGMIVSVSSVGSCVETISIINPCGKQILVCPTLEIQPVLTAIWSGLLSSLSLILVPSTSIILY